MSAALLSAALILAGGCSAEPSAQAADGGAQLDGGTTDAGADDAGAQDAGGEDAGAQDAGNLDAGPADAGADAGTNPLVLARPYHLQIPAGYVPGTPVPLLLMFHGYGASGAGEESYLRLGALADAKTFLYAWADGTPDALGLRFWNATDACCDLYGKGVDDVAYASAILDDVQSKYAVDPKRIFLFGHSNGGFMAHRLACELSDRLAGVVSLAGMTWNDPVRCNAKGPVAVLQIHGDADAVIHYGGGRVLSSMAPYPSARDTVAAWGTIDGCGALQPTGTRLDLDSRLPGAETVVERYEGCRGGAVELWTIQVGSHIPSWTDGWSAPVWDFLAAHPRP